MVNYEVQDLANVLASNIKKTNETSQNIMPTEEVTDLNIVAVQSIATNEAHKATKKYITGCDIRDIADKAIGLFNFKGNAVDELDEHDGIVSGATLTTNHNGTADRAYSFDGVDDVIGLGDHDDYRLQTGSMSVGFIPSANITSTSNNQVLIGLDERHQIQFGNDAGSDNGKLLLEYYDYAWNRIYSGLTSWSADEWGHVVATWDSTTGERKLYVNGSLAASTVDITTIIYASGRGHSLGEHIHNGRLPFNGKIDHFMISDQVLSSTEVETLYQHLRPSDVFSYIDNGGSSTEKQGAIVTYNTDLRFKYFKVGSSTTATKAYVYDSNDNLIDSTDIVDFVAEFDEPLSLVNGNTYKFAFDKDGSSFVYNRRISSFSYPYVGEYLTVTRGYSNTSTLAIQDFYFEPVTEETNIDPFVIGHPVMGNIGSSTLAIDGDYCGKSVVYDSTGDL